MLNYLSEWNISGVVDWPAHKRLRFNEEFLLQINIEFDIIGSFDIVCFLYRSQP